MPEINSQDAHTSALINEACTHVVRTCNTVLRHVDHYGFGLMDVPNPDASKLLALLSYRVIPILANLMVSTDIKPEDGIRLDNLHEYLRLLRNIVEAIKDGDEEAFDAAVEALRGQSFLVID